MVPDFLADVLVGAPCLGFQIWNPFKKLIIESVFFFLNFKGITFKIRLKFQKKGRFNFIIYVVLCTVAR